MFGGAGLLGEQRDLRTLGDRVEGSGATTAKEIEGGVARSGKEKRFRITHAAAGLRAEEAGVGFLHEVVVIAKRRETRLQVGTQGGFMGVNFLGEPTGLFGRWHG